MRLKVKALVGTLACCALFSGLARAQNPSRVVQSVFPPPSGFSGLGEYLRQSIAGRVQLPVAFGTRDSVFSLSLPQDEPAEVYVQLTVGRNGKVREKLTRVNSNHIGTYVAPVFQAAVKGLRVDPQFCAHIQGKDTLLTLTFPVRYQCVLDTVNKAWPTMDDRLTTMPFYLLHSAGSPGYSQYPITTEEWNKSMNSLVGGAVDAAQRKYLQAEPTRVWYYIAFLGDPQE